MVRRDNGRILSNIKKHVDYIAYRQLAMHINLLKLSRPRNVVSYTRQPEPAYI